MTDLVRKLVADLRWRFSSAGKKFRPKRKETESWGSFRIPRRVTLLVWIAFMLFATVGAPDLLQLPEKLQLVLFGWPAWLASAIVLFSGAAALNRRFVISAYRDLLQKNERFSLVEYNRYLSRRISQARQDPSLGGDAEVRRLKAVQKQFVEMLQGGLGEAGLPISSVLSEEAAFAEAHIQAYREFNADPLEQLDSRLPAGLMARVQELERQESASHTAEKQVDN